MSLQLCPSPLLQVPRSVVASNDNGTNTPLPLPYEDFWDLNSVPNAGLTQVYQITNIAQYQGRVIYVNKTQNTAGSTIRISLPGGYTFSSTGTQNYDFPDAPTQLIISISTSAVVAIQTGGSGVGPNSTLINYQKPDTTTGSGNIIAVIGNGSTPTPSYVDCNDPAGYVEIAAQTDVFVYSLLGNVNISSSAGNVSLQGLQNNLNGLNGVFINGTVPTSTNNRYLLSFDSTTKQIERANRYLAANVTTSTIGSSADGSFTNTVTVPADTITATGQSLRFQGDYKISKTSGAAVGTIFAYGLTTALPPAGASPSGCFSNFAAGWTVGPANITDYSMTYDCTVTCATLVASPGLSTFRVHEVIHICDNDGSSPSYPAQTYVFSQGSAFQMNVGAANIFTGNISANAGSNTSFTCYLQKVWFE